MVLDGFGRVWDGLEGCGRGWEGWGGVGRRGEGWVGVVIMVIHRFLLVFDGFKWF